jgi:hypothetical protein
MWNSRLGAVKGFFKVLKAFRPSWSRRLSVSESRRAQSNGGLLSGLLWVDSSAELKGFASASGSRDFIGWSTSITPNDYARGVTLASTGVTSNSRLV